jgi:hypothetical protein
MPAQSSKSKSRSSLKARAGELRKGFSTLFWSDGVEVRDTIPSLHPMVSVSPPEPDLDPQDPKG